MLILAAIIGCSLAGLDATIDRRYGRAALCALGLAACWAALLVR